MSLEEIENTVKFGKDRDSRSPTLVDALNADAGAGTWAFVPSPAAADLPRVAEEDVIRTASSTSRPTSSRVGCAPGSWSTAPHFDNAREPLAQAFKPAGDTTPTRSA